MIALDSIILPEDLWWEDETDWTPVDQEEGWSITGALMLDISTKLTGRPITLIGDESTAWVPRQTILDLIALAADPGREMTLTIHSLTFQVVFRHGDGKPVEADSLWRDTPPAGDDDYILKAIRLLTV